MEFCGGCGERLRGSFCGTCGRPAGPVAAETDAPVPAVEPAATDTAVIREPRTAAMPVSTPVWAPRVSPPAENEPASLPAWPAPEQPPVVVPSAASLSAAGRGSPVRVIAIAVALLLVAGIGAGGAVAWQQGWLPGGARPSAAATSTVTATATPLQEPAAGSPVTEPTPTPTEMTAEELRNEALSTLEQIVADDREVSPVRGQWVAQLASKSEGIVDATQQPEPFTLPDILAEVRSHQANAEYGFMVRVVHQGDWGETEAGPDPMWVTFADINMSSREEVVSWCQDHFSQRGKALLNVCYPRQMKLK